MISSPSITPLPEQLLSSRNLFIDTVDAAEHTVSSGSNYEVHLGADAPTCSDGQIIRMSLTSFIMYNNFFNITQHNNLIHVRKAQSTQQTAVIPPGYAQSIGKVAAAALDPLGAALLATLGIGGTVAGSVVNAPLNPNVALSSSSSRIFDVTYTFSNVHGFAIGANSIGNVLFIQCFKDQGDSYALLGGKRVTDAFSSTSTQQSFKITAPGTYSLRIQGFFPMQRSTMSHLYLRSSLANTGLESKSLSDGTVTSTSQVVQSNILATIPISDEFVSFDSQTDPQFFVNLQQRRVSTLRLTLTDHKNRPIAFAADQDTLGNLSFKCTLRFDVIQVGRLAPLQTKPPPPPQYPLHQQGTLIWENHGAVKY